MKTMSVSKHQIDSFDHFVHYDLAEIVRCEPDTVIKYPSGATCVLSLYDARLTRPYVVDDHASSDHDSSRAERSRRPLDVRAKATSEPDVFASRRNPDGDVGVFPERLILPSEARMRDESYEGSLLCSVSVTCLNEAGEVTHRLHYPQISIARVPIMVRSSLCNIRSVSRDRLPGLGECINDPGGYFIVKGGERVLVSQVRTCDYNKMLVTRQKSQDAPLTMCCARSISDVTSHSVVIKCRFIRGDVVAFNLVYTQPREPIPLGIIFVALGFTDLRSAEKFLRGVPRGGNPASERAGERYVQSMHRAVQAAGVVTRLDALEYIGSLAVHPIHPNRRKKYAEQIVKMEMLPHIPQSAGDDDRAAYIGKMASKLICTRLGSGRSALRPGPSNASLASIAVEGLRGEDDRDDLRHKRVEAAGVLCSTLFRTVYKRYLKAVRQALMKKPNIPPDVPAILSGTNVITQNLRMCFTNPNWGAANNSYYRVGVSQIMSRLNHLAMCSHLRRLATPIGRQGGKNKALRSVHPSQAFFICPMETPEGSTTGIVLNLALTTTISSRVSPVLIEEHIRGYPPCIFSTGYEALLAAGSAMVLVNFRPVGGTTDPAAFVARFNADKLVGKVHWCVTACHDPHDCEVLVFCDEGRLMRPLLVVERMGPFLDGSARTFRECLDAGCIRYVDINEVNFAVIAMRVSEIHRIGATFCEMSPNCMFSIVTGCAPYLEHTQAPRNIYFSNMARQAIAFPVSTFRTRADTTTYALEYPQTPVVTTAFSQHLGFDDMPSGTNAVVAVGTFTGYNQEDGIILNKASIERGMFRITCRRMISCVESNTNTSTQRIVLPPPEVRRGTYDYTHLDDDGIVPVGVYVARGDVVVGRTKTTTFRDRDDEIVDCSVVVNTGEEGFVDHVVLTTTSTDFRLVKVVIRSTRTPEIGDKFCSRSAQKGTVGMILPQEDMPFDEDGVCPDIIINPLCMPSRMTISMLAEMAVGKARCFDGEKADATAFTPASGRVGADGRKNAVIDDICDRLGATGHERHGWSMMTNGRTGRRFGAKVYDVTNPTLTPVDGPVRVADADAEADADADAEADADADGDGGRGGKRDGGRGSGRDAGRGGDLRDDDEDRGTKIFQGVSYYYRLRHLVADKVHARSHGPKQLLTRQPLSGRKREGGMRLGEMERDAVIAIGASAFLRDRLMRCSDPFSLRTCAACGNLAVADECRFCQSKEICTVVIPFASRLLFTELQAMGVKILLFPKKK